MSQQTNAAGLPLWALLLIAGVAPIVTLIGGYFFGLARDRQNHRNEIKRVQEEHRLKDANEAASELRRLEAERHAARTKQEEEARERLATAFLLLASAVHSKDWEDLGRQVRAVSEVFWEVLPQIPQNVREDLSVYMHAVLDTQIFVDSFTDSVQSVESDALREILGARPKDAALRAMKEATSMLGLYLRAWRMGEQKYSDLLRILSLEVPKSVQGSIEAMLKAITEVARAKGVNTEETELLLVESALISLGTVGRMVATIQFKADEELAEKLRRELLARVPSVPKYREHQALEVSPAEGDGSSAEATEGHRVEASDDGEAGGEPGAQSALAGQGSGDGANTQEQADARARDE